MDKAKRSDDPGWLELQAFHVLSAVACHSTRWKLERDAERAGKVQSEILQEILETHADCEYGQRHGFADIKDVETYMDRVPLITYADIEEEVQRMAGGQQNVLSAEEVDHFMLTSGTSRAPKLIPTNALERKRRIPFFAFLPWGTVARSLGTGALFGRGMNGMSIASNDKQTEAGINISSSLRIGLGESTWLMRRLWISPVEAYRICDVEDAYYVHWLFALLDRELVYVSDEFASKMTYSLTVLRRYWDSLVKDIERGKISDHIKLDPDVRRDLEAQLKPNHPRAVEVRNAQARAMDGAGMLKKLWPNMRYVACIYTGTFGVYEERLRHFAGDLPIFNVAYGSSECCVATAFAPNDPRYIMAPRAGFFEFIREDEIPETEPRTYCMDELEVGKRYELVISNFSGLYRYRTADVIKVVGYHRNSPLIEFEYRANVLMNLNAEMMTEQAAYEALNNAAKRVGVRIIDHSIQPDTTVFPPRYIFFVEVAGTGKSETYHALNDALDEELREVNPRYEDRIDRGRLQKSKLRLLEYGAFEALTLMIAKDAQERGISAVQTKIPRLLTNEKYAKLLNSWAHAFGDEVPAIQSQPPPAPEDGVDEALVAAANSEPPASGKNEGRTA